MTFKISHGDRQAAAEVMGDDGDPVEARQWQRAFDILFSIVCVFSVLYTIERQ